MNEHFRIFFFNDGLEIWSAVIKTRLNEIFIYFFFSQYLKNGLKGSFTGKRVFHRGGRLQFLKKWGLVSFCLNQYKAGIFNGTKRFYNVHSFYVICFLVRTPVNIQFREDIIQDFLYHVFDVFYSVRNISLSITD